MGCIPYARASIAVCRGVPSADFSSSAFSCVSIKSLISLTASYAFVSRGADEYATIFGASDSRGADEYSTALARGADEYSTASARTGATSDSV